MYGRMIMFSAGKCRLFYILLSTTVMEEKWAERILYY
jgi:hypothetical protein